MRNTWRNTILSFIVLFYWFKTKIKALILIIQLHSTTVQILNLKKKNPTNFIFFQQICSVYYILFLICWTFYKIKKVMRNITYNWRLCTSMFSLYFPYEFLQHYYSSQINVQWFYLLFHISIYSLYIIIIIYYIHPNYYRPFFRKI